MKKIEHIGLAVKDLSASNKIFNSLFKISPYKEETVASEKVKTSFYKIGDVKIELLQDVGKNGIIANFIKKRGEGLHHIAFEVENIQEEIGRLKERGLVFINEIPKKGADNKLICFIHPKSTNGVLIELCQNIK
tara:strand:- start:88 stop:489 length:402 start_codon:yes stop_codon:yes gene_type:complete